MKKNKKQSILEMNLENDSSNDEDYVLDNKIIEADKKQMAK